MFQLPEIQFNSIEGYFLCVIALLLVFALGKRIIKHEFLPKKCVFCGASVPADEHTHHLEICGLKMMHRREGG